MDELGPDISTDSSACGNLTGGHTEPIFKGSIVVRDTPNLESFVQELIPGLRQGPGRSSPGPCPCATGISCTRAVTATPAS